MLASERRHSIPTFRGNVMAVTSVVCESPTADTSCKDLALIFAKNDG